MKHLRHRTASGDLSDIWEFDSARVVVELVMRIGSAAPLAMTIPVCAVDRPRPWAHPIQRLDGESWRILPARWRPPFGSDPGHYEDAPIHESIGHDLLLCTNAPPDVDVELEAL